jgi:acetylornithine deacetylase
MDPAKLLEELVRIDSTSGKEQEIGEYLAEITEALGFDVEKQKVGNAFNVIAKKGRPIKVLTAHMDTVPPYIPLRKKGEYLYGRGTCDTKGSIAAMVCAGEELIDLTDDFALVFTVHEETNFVGAIEAAKKVRPKFFVVGEPSSNACVFGQKGIVVMDAEFKGKAAHSSLPHLGESAIMKMHDAIARIRAIRLAKGESLNIGIIKGGVADNVIPAHAEFTASFRTTGNNAKIIGEIKRACGGSQLRIKNSLEPIRMPRVVKCKKSVDLYPAFTEMYFWKKTGGVGVICGPGKLEDAHTKDEKVGVKELREAENIYTNLILNVKV